MKKLLTAMMLLLPLAAMAQHWTAPTLEEHLASTVIYAQVNINGQTAGLNDGLELAAFIGDECRADAFAEELRLPTGEPSGKSVFTLRVIGYDGSDGVSVSEIGQTITFRAFYQNIEYQFTLDTEKFQGDVSPYEPNTPLVLNLYAVTGISLEETINVNQLTFPYELDLSPYVKLVYGGAEKKDDSEIISPITYTWTTDNENMLTFDNVNNKVMINVDGTATANLTVYVGRAIFPAPGEIPATTTIIATIKNIPVKSITCDIQSTVFYAFEDFRAFIAQHIKVEPGDASTPEYRLVCQEHPEVFSDDRFTMGGEYTIDIVPVDQEYQGEHPKVIVSVYVRPTNIATTAENNTINVYYGDNVYAIIKEMQTLTWPNGIDDPGEWGMSEVDYAYNPQDQNLIDAEGKAVGYGCVNVTVTLTKGITPSMTFQGSTSYTVTVNINTAMRVTAQVSDNINFVKMNPQTVALVTVNNPKQETFKPTDLAITFSERYPGFPYATWAPKVESTDGVITTYAIILTPLFVGDCTCNVTYKGNELLQKPIDISISKKEELSKGWTWLALTTKGDDVANLFTQSDIVEIRSQGTLTYNDPVYGYFGNLTTLSADEAMYKVNTKNATSVNWGSNALMMDMSQLYYKTIKKGYNWMNYPYEFDVTLDRIPEFLGPDFTPADGDRIIIQGNFAVYNGQTWTANEAFALKEGKGLVYYSTSESSKVVDFYPNLAPSASPAGGNARMESFTMPSMADEILKYDVHAFADNMSMIAEFEDLDFPEDYTLGVFVNGECRGRGSVAVDGKMFVSAVGTSGENVTFKLVNNYTGDILPVEGSVTFGQVKGSLHAPVKLNIGDTTGISKVGGTQQTNDVYDLSGRRITSSQRGVSIERMANGTIRKVVKK